MILWEKNVYAFAESIRNVEATADDDPQAMPLENGKKKPVWIASRLGE